MWRVEINNVNLTEGGLFKEDCVVLASSETEAAKFVQGATKGHGVTVFDVQAKTSTLTLKVIYGELAHRTLVSLLNKQRDGVQNPYTIVSVYKGLLSKVVPDKDRVPRTTNYVLNNISFKTYPDDTIFHANAGEEQFEVVFVLNCTYEVSYN